MHRTPRAGRRASGGCGEIVTLPSHVGAWHPTCDECVTFVPQTRGICYRWQTLPTATIAGLELANRPRPVLLQLGRSLRREAHALGVTGGQASVLAWIQNHPEYGVRDLAAREGISVPAMSRYLDRMETAGLIVRERSERDARRVQLSLTPRGSSALRSVRSRRTAWLAARLGGLSQAELEAIDAAIEPLLRLVEEE